MRRSRTLRRFKIGERTSRWRWSAYPDHFWLAKGHPHAPIMIDHFNTKQTGIGLAISGRNAGLCQPRICARIILRVARRTWREPLLLMQTRSRFARGEFRWALGAFPRWP